jgi:apolipoprotein N-acyltransferase
MLALVVLPGLAAAVLRGHRATAVIEDRTLVIARDHTRLEVPCEAIALVQPSLIPLPDVGIDIVLRSGRRVVPGLEVDDPAPLLDSLARAGAPAEPAREATGVVAAIARSSVARQWWDHPLIKFALFAIVPAGVLFNVHQHISYGAFWGEYHTLGARAWLRTLATYYAVTVIYCMLFASALRAPAEAMALLAAAVEPARAAWARRCIEAACRVGYYAGVPLLLLAGFAP